MDADFTGAGNFSGANILDEPYSLEVVDTGGAVHSSSTATPANLQLRIVTNTTASVVIELSGVAEATTDAKVSETWTIALDSGVRTFSFNSSGQTTSNLGVKCVRHSVGFASQSIYGLFSQGVVQMKNAKAKASHFPSNDILQRAYTMGGGSSVDILLDSPAPTHVLKSSGGTGLHEILVGKVSLLAIDEWGPGPFPGEDGESESGPSSFFDGNVDAGETWTTGLRIAPNDRNFPCSQLTTEANMPDYDLEAYMTGVFGSSPGCLCTYPNEVEKGKHVYQIATTIARPDRGYGGTYNYFDPDNFISLSAMLYSGDPYLQLQARQVVERSGAFLKVTNDKYNGQLPHHFEGSKPTYTALSGATQTGPNTFWTKTALQYAKVTGDIDWLKGYMPTLRNSSGFCFDLIDDTIHLLDAPGSLMIDVFIREHYTADSNAMMVGFLREFAEAEDAVGNSTGATALRSKADLVSSAVNDKLWAMQAAGSDHYITQLNPDGTTRDFVDYDANLIAVAHGVTDDHPGRAESILARIDQGPAGTTCTAAKGGGPQYVSEKYYGKADTTSGNTGDSNCSMARIAWFDAHARKRIGTRAALDMFDSKLLAPIQRDLVAKTWLGERYNCEGENYRTADYFEYPSAVAMLLREIRYGINMGLTNITINPFLSPASDGNSTTADFHFHVGNINVDYSEAEVTYSLPGKESKTGTITGLTPSSSYSLTTKGDCSSGSKALKTENTALSTDAAGVLVFQAPLGVGCTVTVSLAQLSRY
jgi:hypothetical protein